MPGVRGPNFLVAGTARAGTTALVEALRQHPDVFVTQPKEPHYFALHGTTAAFTGPGDDVWVNQRSITDRDTYLGLFAEAGDRRARGDGSVTTLYYADHAAEEIVRLNPQMRIVVILREPIERAFSSYVYLRLRGFEDQADFASALAREDSRREAGWHHMWHYLRMSYYADNLRTLIDAVGRERVGVWFYDDVQADFTRVVSEIVEFLQLDPYSEGPPEMPRINASGRARSQVAQDVVRWATRHERVRSAVKRVMPIHQRERIRASLVKSESVPEELRAELAPRFDADLAAVAALLDQPVPSWLTPARRGETQ